MTGVGWYEWNLLAALDRREDGITYNLYARTFLAPDDPPPRSSLFIDTSFVPAATVQESSMSISENPQVVPIVTDPEPRNVTTPLE